MRIGEVARRSGVSTRMLRHYDSLGLVRPTGRTSTGYREYTDADIQRIFHVESLRTLGLSLRQVGEALDDPAFAPATLIADLIADAEERLRREKELLKRLRAVDASAPTGWEAVLRITELLHGLASPSAARRQQAILAPEAELPADTLAEAALTESDLNVAGALRWALARSGQGAAKLAPALASKDAKVRRSAVLALAKIDDEASTDLLTAALDDADDAVRRHTALALGARGKTEAVPMLMRMVTEGTNDVDAAERLAQIAQDEKSGERIRAALIAAMNTTVDIEVRSRLVQAAAEMPPDIALDVLEHFKDDENETIARTAQALAAIIENR
ncbi:MerR family transcriptional regulator [Glycomyces sp. NPDC046736]|uniref:MerR family transcriptional regulator n=1 Tax=Glycomyces sp. NPDC046736 TaxID=3155615 RepID=UPI0033E11C06